MGTINVWETTDIRFPTSLELDGSDAMNPDPDYSAAYVSFGDSQADLIGHASVFTIGRGNDVQVAALEALRPYTSPSISYTTKTALYGHSFFSIFLGSQS